MGSRVEMDKMLNKWLSPSKLALPNALREWVLHKGSFMLKLKEQGFNPIVHVIQQEWKPASIDQENSLQCQDAEILCREVLISDGDKKFMYAETLFPRSTLTGKEAQLAHLNNKSLGSILFTDPNWERGEFEVACFDEKSEWYNKIAKQTKAAAVTA